MLARLSFLGLGGRARLLAGYGFMLYFASFFFVGASQQKTVFYAMVALPSLFVALDFKEIFQQRRIELVSILLFLVYFSLSSIWSSSAGVLDGVKVSISILLLMISIFELFKNKGDSDSYLLSYVVLIGALFCVVYGGLVAYNVFFGDIYDFVDGRASLRILSGIGESNPINSAIYAGLLVVAAWWFFPSVGFYKKFGLVVLIFVCVMILLMSKSRGPLLALGVSLGLLSVFRRDRVDWLLAGLFLFSALFAWLFSDVFSVVVNRFGEPNYRLEIWSHSLQLIQNNFLFGQGLGESANIPFNAEGGTVVTVTHSHSSVLEAFRIGGVIGGALFVSLVVLVVFRSMTTGDARGFYCLWIIYGLLCLSTNGRFVLIRPSVEWFCFWIPLFLAVFSPRKVRLVKN